jgi:hypothetical protein
MTVIAQRLHPPRHVWWLQKNIDLLSFWCGKRPVFLVVPERKKRERDLGQCSKLKSSMPFKISLSQNNPSKRNPKLKMKTLFEVLNIICPSQEPTSVGHCHYKKWS